MSGLKRYPSTEGPKISTPKRESKSFQMDTYVEAKKMKLQRSTSPMTVCCSEGETIQVQCKEEKQRSESLSPRKDDMGDVKVTNTNVQNDKKIDSLLSLSKDLSVSSSCIKPSSSIPIPTSLSKSSSDKSSCPFQRGIPSGDLSSNTIRDGSISHNPNLNIVKPQIFDKLCEKNDSKLLITNELYKEHLPNSSLERLSIIKEADVKSKMPFTNVTDYKSNVSNCHVITDQMTTISNGGGLQINEYAHKDDLNAIDGISKESQLFPLDHALRQFDLLDELDESGHEERETMESSSKKSDSEFDEELPIDDIDEMLEEGLPEKFKSSGSKEGGIKLRQKIVLEEIGHNHFDLLPEGWIQITHSCGMPVYLNRKSRVCTMARPYYLGPGSSRNHKIPLSAIPCLQYKRASEVEEKNNNNEEREMKQQSQKAQSEIELMSAKIETFEENRATQSLEASELNEYCQKRFKFKTLTLVPFKTWADRRKYVKMRKEIQTKQRPTLPGGTKLLKFPIKNVDGTVSKSREWIINPNGKSYVCILHEYVQHALKKHPKYLFKELENPATPYSATVFIEDMQYGFGIGASKKHAKVEAAKAALEVLVPGMKDKIKPDGEFGMYSGTSKRSNDTDISIFDQIKVEDPRVAEFCAKSTEPPPYAILLTCLGRNTGAGEVELSSISYKQDEFTMTVGNHKATVACRNKREGKQRAAQAILKALHPNITYWGSLLRMYGNKSIKEKKQEEQEIIQLQSKASLDQPNLAILDKLETEMLKLKDRREAVKAKGKFILPEDIFLSSLSSTDLNKVNLLNKH